MRGGKRGDKAGQLTSLNRNRNRKLKSMAYNQERNIKGRYMAYKFSHEKLEVYQLELQFIKWITPLITEAKKKSGSMVRETIDHLERASLSILFNTSEGNGKREMPVRARFFDDARGSSAECASCLDALVAIEMFNDDRIDNGKDLLIRIYNILSKFVEKYSRNGKRVR